MGIERSRILGELHPWLRVRVEWIEQELEYYGAFLLYFSGGRTLQQQRDLWEKRQGWLGRLTGRPVAPPGCSQHNYDPSLAVDVGVFGEPTDAGVSVRDFWPITKDLAREVGLVTVDGDEGHLAVFPGPAFAQWARSWGYCSDLNRFHFQATSVSCDLFGCIESGETSTDRFRGE